LFVQGFLPLPKSVTKTRIEENADVYDFELTPEEMKSLDTGAYAPSAWDPTTSKD
jgi:diketogulonate reductase-like aldo/keto reductase